MKGVLARISSVWDWLLRTVWNIALACHITAAAAWWWLMPGGFPIDHPRFWFNQVVPWIIILCSLVARVRWGQAPWIISLRVTIPGAAALMWLTGAFSAVIVFPQSFRWKYLGAFFIGLMLGLIWTKMRRLNRAPWPWVNWIVLPVAFLIGACFPVSQHARPPATHPLGGTLRNTGAATTNNRRTVALGNGVSVDPGSASVRFTSGNCVLSIQPLLTIESRSPDGCWTLFAPRYSPQQTRRTVRGARGNSSSGFDFTYIGDGNTTMTVWPGESPGRTEISATTQISQVWSHLNTFTELAIAGHKKLCIRFSPCPDARIEVTPQDYPFGRPARFAFLDARGTFHVVEATNAEKGPFKDLATGPLPRGSPIWIELIDDQTPLFRINFDDWSAECSTQLSPTAGWGVPENSIEFSRDGNAPASAASVFITLAATSVGRGYDTVGLAAGAYRNRMWVQQFSNSATKTATSSPTLSE